MNIYYKIKNKNRNIDNNDTNMNILSNILSKSDEIKSFFLLKRIFSFIDEKRKLELIKYNKSIQNKIDIDIIYYIQCSKKYIK